MNEHTTAQQAWQQLVDGNQRYASGSPAYPQQDAARRESLAGGQQPTAVVFGCGDSRVPVELLFDQGLGDVFVVRTAGQALDDAVLGSLEFGVEPLQVPLLVVLGHSSCGAVGAAMAAAETGEFPSGHVRAIAEKVLPTVLQCRSRGETDYRAVVDAHVRATIDLLLEQSPMIKDAVDSGRLALVGATYQLEDGLVAPVATVGDVTA